MDLTWSLVWPAMMILGRVSAFLAAAPIFSSGHIPNIVKVGLAVILTGFMATIVPLTPWPVGAHWGVAALALVQEILCGLAMGLAGRFVYLAVQQSGVILAQQMGLTDAEVIDPASGEENESMVNFLEITFAALFLLAGGHQLLLMVLAKSYQVFPIGQTPSIAALCQAVVAAGSTMLVLALKLAAPSLAAFFILTVVLGVLARVMPEMNILFESFPLRVGLGLIMAAAILPSLSAFNGELGMWIQRSLVR